MIITLSRPLDDAHVLLDDQAVEASQLGVAMPLDPGPHAIVVQSPTLDEPLHQSITVIQGAKNQLFSIVVPAPPPPPPLPPPVPQPAVLRVPTPSPTASRRPEPHSWWPPHPVVWVGFGVAAVGATAGAVTGGIALSRGTDLDMQCATSGCTQREIDDAGAIADVATASLIIAGVGAAVGIVALAIDLADDPDDVALAFRF